MHNRLIIDSVQWASRVSENGASGLATVRRVQWGCRGGIRDGVVVGSISMFFGGLRQTASHRQIKLLDGEKETTVDSNRR